MSVYTRRIQQLNTRINQYVRTIDAKNERISKLELWCILWFVVVVIEFVALMYAISR